MEHHPHWILYFYWRHQNFYLKNVISTYTNDFSRKEMAQICSQILAKMISWMMPILATSQNPLKKKKNSEILIPE
jgi:hypothetical protein